MLDIHALKTQLAEYMEHRATEAQKIKTRLDRLVALYLEASAEADRWREIAGQYCCTDQTNDPKPSLLVAGIPTEPGRFLPPAESQPAYYCFAADGSQIMPSRHELPDLALVQIGKVAIGYRTASKPLIESQSHLITQLDFQKSSGSSVDGLRFDQFVTDTRSMMELEGLAEICQIKDPNSPGLALMDGTLIFWSLSDRPIEWRTEQLDHLSEQWQILRQNQTPVAGYISSPGSRDVINALGVFDYFRCYQNFPGKPADLFSHPETGQPSDFAPGVTDRMLFDRLLEKEYRSGWFASGSHILNNYAREDRIRFCYLKTQSEVVRIEIPAWAESYESFLHSRILDQCRKGKGYPITLSESHEQAIVRGPDRELFYRLAYEQLRQSRLKTPGRSPLPRPSAKQRSKIRPLF